MTAAKKSDAYDVVTSRILEALEAGVVPWHRPWNPGGEQRSLSTGRPYTGVNVFVLEATAAIRGYESPWWTTFNQARQRGGAVRKGEKGTPVVFWKFIDRPNPDDPDRPLRIPFLRYFTVFNAEQVDDLTVPEVEALADHEPIAECERIARAYRDANGPRLRHGGDSAFYRPSADLVQLPVLGQFETVGGYYGTLFHEFAHSTGHESRLARKTLLEPAPFGSEDYSQEELVAEMTAAFVCGAAGIPVNVPQHAGYIGAWLSRLGSDPKLVVHAAGAAQRAANLILSAGATDDDGSPADREAVTA